MASLLLLMTSTVFVSRVYTQSQHGSHFTGYTTYGWSSTPLYCTNGTDCVVNCFGQQACDYAVVYGPRDAILTINCNTDANEDHTGWQQGSSCLRLTAHAEDSLQLHINVYNENGELGEADIYTPTNTQIPNTFITCGIVGANNLNQQPTDNVPSWMPNVCGLDNNIYSKNGFESVLWTYSDQSIWALDQCPDAGCDSRRGNTMNCGSNYESSCSPLVITDGVNFNCPQSSPCFGASRGTIAADNTTNTPISTNGAAITTLIYTTSKAHTTSKASDTTKGTITTASDVGSQFTGYDAYGWSSTPLYCADYTDCVVNCYGAQACDYAVIYGPQDAILTINCDSDAIVDHTGWSQGLACIRLTVHAEDSAELRLNVYNENGELAEADIYTPTNTQTPNTFITCGIIGANNLNQQPIDAQPSWTPNVCGLDNNIYSKNGFESVLWTYSDQSIWALDQCPDAGCDSRRGNTMNCGSNYESSCSPLVITDGVNFNCLQSSACYGDLTGTTAPDSTTNAPDSNTTKATRSTPNSDTTTNTTTPETTDATKATRTTDDYTTKVTRNTPNGDTSSTEIADTTEKEDATTDISTTATCDDQSVLDWQDPCEPDPEVGCALIFDIDVKVCVLTKAMTREHLRNSIRKAMGAIISGLADNDVVCSEDEMYLLDIDVSGINNVVHASNLVSPQADNCPVVVDECGSEANDDPQFDVTISLALRCGDTSDDCKEVQALAKRLYDFAEDGVLGLDFAKEFLSNTVGLDSVCDIGLGRVVVDDTITVTLKNEDGNIILLLDVNVGNGAVSRAYLIAGIAVMAVFALF